MEHNFDFNNQGYWHEMPSPQFELAASPSGYPYDCYQAQPMARYASSSGSSPASSVPDSPLGLRAIHAPSMSESFSQSSYYAPSPQAAMEELPSYASSAASPSPSGNETSYSGRDWPVFCLMPGCNARPFKRCADLQRHYKNTHAPESLRDSYLCDYPRCTRSREPFHRRDHFRDHLREYHREDIQKRGSTINEEWLEGRYLPSSWWRCPRCLLRVYVSKSGFDCPGCKTSCESRRKAKRRSRSRSQSQT
ncbi:hypothetical protein BGZ63DRAFT_21287 [Mariannaea sp. PMI_226]|nr:hypothetical protein BGZ63DRAFT_21287 [Mariannaea sp. PMI_226]